MLMRHSLADTLKHYYITFAVTAVILLITLIAAGPAAVLPIITLAAIEMTFSFENAVINSQVLSHMAKIWQTVFLTVGIAVAVFGVRLVLPLVLVSTTTGHPVGTVLDQALHKPDIYAEHLHEAYPVIASFGGTFLLMVGLHFFSERKKVHWINKVEEPLSDFNQPWWVSIAGAVVAILASYLYFAPGQTRVLKAAVLGAVVFMAIRALTSVMTRQQEKSEKRHTHHSGLVWFLYLEVLDASFSFDGVIAAFAITKEVLLIAAGLGIGALYVRSITVHLLKQGTLAQYRYLVHGAHYAMTALAILLLISIRVDIPEAITGLLGLTIVGLSFVSSRRENRREAAKA